VLDRSGNALEGRYASKGIPDQEDSRAKEDSLKRLLNKTDVTTAEQMSTDGSDLGHGHLWLF